MSGGNGSAMLAYRLARRRRLKAWRRGLAENIRRGGESYESGNQKVMFNVPRQLMAYQRASCRLQLYIMKSKAIRSSAVYAAKASKAWRKQLQL